MSIRMLVVLFVGVAILCSCERPHPPLRDEARAAVSPPRTSAEALERARKLVLSRQVRFEIWKEVEAPAVRSDAMAPADGLALWQELHRRRAETGLTPLVIDANVDPFSGDENPTSPAASLARARGLSVSGFFNQRGDHRDTMIEYLALKLGVPRASLPASMTWPEIAARCRELDLAECSDADPVTEALRALDRVPATVIAKGQRKPAHYEFARRNEAYAEMERSNPGLGMPKLSVRVALIAAPAHELPAYLRIGGWNAMPFPHEHVVVLEHWNRRYGAELVFYGGDVFELAVERPPETLAELKDLTREQFLYCADIVEQGVGDVDALARELAGRTSWYFWWD